MRNIADLAASIATPAIHLVSIVRPSKSHLGGSPRLPSDIPWPEWQGRRLGFLARLSLPELHRVHKLDWLPPSGALLFFYDVDEQPWGFDPKDRGGCFVILVPELSEPLAASPERCGEDEYFPQVNVAFRKVEVLPSTERPEVESLNLSDEEREQYWSLLDTPFEGLPKHQVAGLPAPVQGDYMELECQLASNGLYCGDSSGYQDPRAKQLEAGAKDWRLLLQLDTDDDAGVMWGDCGTLYFWVRGDEAAEGNFANTWLVLQCS
jgi:uncharacterized protein YwqG